MNSIGKYPILHLSKYQLDFGNFQIIIQKIRTNNN